MASFGPGRLHHSARHFAEWIPYFRDWLALREHRAADDSQHHPSPGWPLVFCAFPDPAICRIMVVTKGRRPEPQLNDRMGVGITYEFDDGGVLDIRPWSIEI